MIRKLCDVHQLPNEGELRAFVDDNRQAPLALCVGLLQGKPYAIENRCPHQGAPLSAGKLVGEHVACPLHGWRWRLADGKAASPVDPNVPSLELRQYGNEVFVRIPSSDQMADESRKSRNFSHGQSEACKFTPFSDIR